MGIVNPRGRAVARFGAKALGERRTGRRVAYAGGEMFVQLGLPDCDPRKYGIRDVSEPVDAFWVECTPDEAATLVEQTTWKTSQQANMNNFLSVQQVVWSITKGSTTVNDTITTFGDTSHWSTPVIGTDGLWSSTFTDNTGVTLAGPPTGGGPGEQATLTFSIIGDKQQAVIDDGGIVWKPQGNGGVLSPTNTKDPRYTPITATCTLEGQ